MSGLPARSPELRGLRILLVEDEFLVALELESMLQELGGEVIGPLGSLDQAVAVAREEALDVAVLDVNVGGRLVTPVADALAARTIPFVFCTGYDAASLPGRHAAAPMLMKPCQAHELKNVLLSALPRREGPARAAGAPQPTGRQARRSPTIGAGRARRAGRRPGD
jgi:DNA-binding LytR/AlgR family response regulator